MFRFQTGSIKRVHQAFCSHQTQTFRFQTGSIKRRSEQTPPALYLRFDSKLVRLKGTDTLKEQLSIMKVSIPNWFD